jgi:hypothetical protein
MDIYCASEVRGFFRAGLSTKRSRSWKPKNMFDRLGSVPNFINLASKCFAPRCTVCGVADTGSTRALKEQ